MTRFVSAVLVVAAACGDDAGPTDGGADGGGRIDSGVADSGATDAGESDAGSLDGALPNNVLLDLDIGNQITRSYLTIYDEGTVLHEEQTCCPPNRELAASDALTAAQLAQLVTDASAVAAAGTSRTDLGPFAEGSQNGYVRVQVSGATYTVRELFPEGSDRIENQSDATEAVDSIVTLVNAIIDVDVQ